AVWIVLNDGNAEPTRDCNDGNPPWLGDRVGRGIEQSWIEIKRTGRQPLARVGEGVRIDTFVVHWQADEPQTKLRRDRADAGIGERFGENDIAGLRYNPQDAEKRGMCAGRDEKAILQRDQGAAAKPSRGRILVGLHATKALVTQERDEIPANRLKP